MTQLIIDDIELPETWGDKYQCGEELLSKTVQMISGRTVQEVRGKVWVIEYAFDYMGNTQLHQVMQVLRSGKSFVVHFLPDSGDELVTSKFICTNLTPPTFAFSRDRKGLWHNLSFTLREVRPHD